MRVLVPLVLALAAGWSLLGWYERRYDSPPPAAPPVAPAPPVADTAWLRTRLGPPPAGPPVFELQERLAAWGPPDTVAGWEDLRAPDSAAARAEMDRWLQLPLGGPVKVVRLAFEAVAGGVEIEAVLAGPAAGVLPALAYLLAGAAGDGYLTDPLAVRLTHDPGSGLSARLLLRVRPAAVLLAAEGS